MLIVRKSPFSGKTNEREIDVSDEQMEDWLSGTVIQKAMPHLSADDREFIITGIMPDEWEATFGHN